LKSLLTIQYETNLNYPKTFTVEKATYIIHYVKWFIRLWVEFYVNTVKCLYGVSVPSDGQEGDIQPMIFSPGRPLT